VTISSNELLNVTPMPSWIEQGQHRDRLVQRLPRPLVAVVTLLGFAAPVIGYFLLVRGYSLNVVTGDQWDDVVVIGRSHAHLFDWSSLWAQHNENRIFFPNLIVLLLAYTTAFNVQVEEYLSFVLLLASTGLIIGAHKRGSPDTPWLYLCPVAILMLSVVQYENALWGFQMAWYLVLLCLALSLFFLDRMSSSAVPFTIAILSAIVGSYSSLQGLLIWPAGLLVLCLCRRRALHISIWLLAAALTASLYFYNWDPSTGTPRHNYALQHPIVAVKFFLFMMGDVVGMHVGFGGSISYAVMAFGLVVTLLSLFTLVVGFRSRVGGDGRAIGMALIVVGLLFAAIVTSGRVALGLFDASSSRYTTFTLLTVVGIYLTLLGPFRAAQVAPSPVVANSRAQPLRGFLSRRGVFLARWCLLPVILIQVVFGLHYGLSGASDDHRFQVQAVHVLRTIDRQSDSAVSYYLYLFHSAKSIRQDTQILRADHLSIFAGGSRGQ
jgi:hypothetical protein